MLIATRDQAERQLQSQGAPSLVSSMIAVVIVRVYPAILPPTIMMAPTSEIDRPNPAKAGRQGLQPVQWTRR